MLINKKIIIFAFLVTLSACMIHTSKAFAATSCGVHRGNPDTSLAGLVVGFRAKDSTGKYRMPSTSGVTVVVDTRPQITTPPGGVVRIDNDNVIQERKDKVRFGLQSGDRYNCVAGGNVYGNTVLGYDKTTTDWALDCDGSVRNHTSLQRFNVTPSGTPPGLRGGGYWSIDQYIPADHGINRGQLGYEVGSPSNRFPTAIVSPENGDTAELIFTYHEPIDWNLDGYSCFVNSLSSDGRYCTTKTVSSAGDRTIAPGSAVFYHTVVNRGPDQADFHWKIITDIYDQSSNRWTSQSSPLQTSNNVNVDSADPNKRRSTFDASSLVDGDRVCQSLRYDSATGPGTGTEDTNRLCYTIKTGPIILATVYLPYFTAKNSSVWSGAEYRDVNSECVNDGILASWNNSSKNPASGAGADLAAFANGEIVGFASKQKSGIPSVMELTFANTSVAKNDASSPHLGGNYGASKCLTDFEVPANTTSLTSMVPVSLNSLSSGSYKSSNSPINIAGGSIPLGSHINIYVDGDVFISGNIKFATAGWTTTNMPSFVLRAAGNIYISNNVSQLDGVYIAHPKSDKTKGTIYTCAVSVNPPAFFNNSVSLCNNQLTVNGVFIASKINLLRTFGDLNDVTSAPNKCTVYSGAWSSSNSSDVSGTCAAEIFQLSPEIYMNGTTNSSSGTPNQYKYDYITNLPPIL